MLSPPAEASPSQCQDPLPYPSSFARHPTLPGVRLLSCFQKLFQKLEVSTPPQVKGHELCHLPPWDQKGKLSSFFATDIQATRAGPVLFLTPSCGTDPLSHHLEAELYSVPSLKKSEMKSTLEMLPSERTWHGSLSV